MAEVKTTTQDYVYDAQPQGYQQLQSQQQQQQHAVVQQPQSKDYSRGQPQNIRQWTTGVFDCFDDDLCEFMYDCCCPLCSMCSMAAQMDECVLGPLCLGLAFETAMRTKLRAQLGIQGSVFNDVCLMIWCSCCATSQMSREMRNIGYRP